MVSTFSLILALTGLLIVSKLALIALWSRRLHLRQGRRYRYSAIFGILFFPKNADDVDESMWKDLQPIQRWNFLSGLLFLALAWGAIAINVAI